MSGALTLKAKTSNGGGVAASTELVSNYGLRWADAGKRARLHDYFSISRSTAAATVSPQEGTPAPPKAAPPKAQPPKADPPPAPTPPPPSQPQPTPPPPVPPKPEAKDKSPREKNFDDHGVLICEVEDPKTTWKLIVNQETQAPLIQVRLLEDKNRKFTKLQMLRWFAQGKLVKSPQQPQDSLPYSEGLSASSFVIDVTKDKAVVTLKELIKSSNANEVHGFQPFLAGSCPNKLQRPESEPPLYLSNVESLLGGISLALQSIPHMRLAWGFKLLGTKTVATGCRIG